MSFYTALSCLDGRIHLPLITYLQKKYEIEYVDLITAPGLIRFFANDSNSVERVSIIEQARLSLQAHDSQGIALVAHFDCAGNPLSRDEQILQLRHGVVEVSKIFPDVPLRGIWINSNWGVEES